MQAPDARKDVKTLEKITETTFREIEELAKPLAEYIHNHYNPHTTIIITDERVTVVEDLLGMPLYSD